MKNLRNSLLCFSAGALWLAACAREPEDAPVSPDPADIAAARDAASALGGRLKTRLVETIPESGPVAAIEVCNLEAPEIANALSEEKGMAVGRTALRWRNPDNAPDAFERAAMEMFLAEIEAGADPAGLEHAEIVTTAEGRQLRYMKPIMTGGPCVLCHGAAISEEVKTAIAARYPDDRATGFAPGEFRGAFTITKDLSP
ncbi:Tll0287-like domain-containing protein [Hyphococcus sp.]|uniref:Tll0287-like domain-containing protein n=1 Tax=Hyphococcus sp. TaxID=2038636 RepID=UPI0035C73CDF